MKARKFTYVESAYFERWWSEISPQKQALVKQLVANKQLEFNLGNRFHYSFDIILIIE